MASNDPIDFTLPAGNYSATLSTDATSFDPTLRLSSDTAPNPVTGRAGIPTAYGFLVHPNEITRQAVKDQRTAAGKSNGPFNTPGSLGCILLLNKEEFNSMWSTLIEHGYKIGDSINLEIKNAE